MANRILTSTTYYDEIRGRLGVDSTILPNSDIDSRSILTIGEARVVSRVPDYATLSGDDQVFSYAAAVAMVASLLAPSMGSRIKKSEGDSDYKYENTNVDWRTRASELEDEAYMWIDYISTQAIVELPQMGVAGPTRANANQTILSPTSGDIGLYPTNVE